MKLGVYSLKKVLYEGKAKSVNLKAEHGELTILDSHRPLIAVLSKGQVKITKEDGGTEEISIESGFLEVKPDSVVNILAD